MRWSKAAGAAVAVWRRYRLLSAQMRRAVAAAGAVVLLAVVAVVAGLTGGRERPPVGLPVPVDQVSVIDAAAHSCPTLSPVRLAGQLMADTGFDTNVGATSGGAGVAGLTAEQWDQWAPWPQAMRLDPAANIVALAHHMCDLVGQLRAAEVTGDIWRNALAAHRMDVSAVTRAGGVPDEAVEYVELVAAYTAWYEQHNPFTTVSAGPEPLSPPSAGGVAASSVAAKPLPEAYLTAVIAAGRMCPTITPARVAAQLMAASGFNPKLLSPTGAQGIAQFQPELWRRYAPSPAASPWDPTVAIPALGSAMCDLVAQVGSVGQDPYSLALGAFQRGSAVAGQPAGAVADPAFRQFTDTVLGYAEYYTRDTRLASKAPPVSRRPATTSTPKPPQSTTAGPVTPPVGGWTTVVVYATRVLLPGEAIKTNRIMLLMQGDGNLVVIDEYGRIRWSSGTAGRGVRTVFQADGDLVVYDGGNGVAWRSGTAGHDGAVLVLQSDGNVTITFNGQGLWHTGTN
ncbi:hypothetical protein ABZS66_11390 [Dactylosporangium sp. NPDC005572]|uniref:hypothetical protein n=1 Tax=Dactylosporangium sp. NPDC005572 TaxID=3156889 RepID=UPI0033AF3BFA